MRETITIGGYYRMVYDVNIGTYSDNDLTGPGAIASFKFGWF